VYFPDTNWFQNKSSGASVFGIVGSSTQLTIKEGERERE